MTQILKDIGETYGQFDMPLFEISGTTVTIAPLITFALVVIVTFALAGLAQRAVVRAFSKEGEKDQGTTAVASRLIR